MSTCITVWPELHRLAEQAIKAFGLRGFKKLVPLRNPRARMYGACSRDGVVELRVNQLGRATRPLSRRCILDTLAHELAHLKYFNEGIEHRNLTREILTYWNREEE